MRTLFLDNTLLEHGPLDDTFQDQKDFSYIPIVFQRRFKTGVPYGLLESMKDIQRDCNARVTKSIYAINSARLIFEGNPLQGQTIESIQEQLQKIDAVIALPRILSFNCRAMRKWGKSSLKLLSFTLS